MEATIRKAEEKMTYISCDKEALHAYQMREMALSDWTSGINHAHREGVKEGVKKGVKKGIQKEAKEIAKNMKADGEPVGRIMRYTRLTEQQIGEL
jgi:predicted transposase/invertase (TIGR01784 family)